MQRMEQSESGADSDPQDDIYPAFNYYIQDFEHFYDPYVSKTHHYKFFLPSRLVHAQTIVDGYNHPVQPYRPLCDDPSDPLFYLNIPIDLGATVGNAVRSRLDISDIPVTDHEMREELNDSSRERTRYPFSHYYNMPSVQTGSALHCMTAKLLHVLRRNTELPQPAFAQRNLLAELPYPSVVIRPIAPYLTYGLTPSGQHCKHRALEQATFYLQYEEDFGVVCFLLAKLLGAALCHSASALHDIKYATGSLQRGVPFTLAYINVDSDLIPPACLTILDMQTFLRYNADRLGSYDRYSYSPHRTSMFPPTTAERIIDADELADVNNTANMMEDRITQFTDFKVRCEHAIQVPTKSGLLFVPAESKWCTTTYRLVYCLMAVCDSSYFTTGPLASILPVLRDSPDNFSSNSNYDGTEGKLCPYMLQPKGNSDDSGQNGSRPATEKTRRTNREKYEYRGFEDEAGLCKVCNRQYSSYFRHSVGENHLSNYAAAFDTPLRKKASNLLYSTYETCRQYVERHMTHLNKRSYLNAQMHVIASYMAARHLIYYETACRMLTLALFYFDVQFVVSEVESVVRADSPTARSAEFVDFVRQQRERRTAADETAANVCFSSVAGASVAVSDACLEHLEQEMNRISMNDDETAVYAQNNGMTLYITQYYAGEFYEALLVYPQSPVICYRLDSNSVYRGGSLHATAMPYQERDSLGSDSSFQDVHPACGIYRALAEQLSLVRPIRRGFDVYAALTAKWVTLTPGFYSSCLYSQRARNLHMHFVNYVESIYGHAIGREVTLLSSEYLVAALRLFDLDTVYPCVIALAAMVKNALLATGEVTFSADSGLPQALHKAYFEGFEELGEFNIRGPEQTVGIPLLQAVYRSVFEEEVLQRIGHGNAQETTRYSNACADILQACEYIYNGFELPQLNVSEDWFDRIDAGSSVLVDSEKEDAEYSAPCGDELEVCVSVRSNSVGWRDYSQSKDYVSFVQLKFDYDARPTSNFVRCLVDMTPEQCLLDCAKDCLLSLQDNYGLGLHDAMLVEMRALQLLAEAYQGIIDGTGVAVVPYERYTLRMMCGVY